MDELLRDVLRIVEEFGQDAGASVLAIEQAKDRICEAFPPRRLAFPGWDDKSINPPYPTEDEIREAIRQIADSATRRMNPVVGPCPPRIARKLS